MKIDFIVGFIAGLMTAVIIMSMIARMAKVHRHIGMDTMIYYDEGECDLCGKIVDVRWEYCPECGARLDWSGNETD